MTDRSPNELSPPDASAPGSWVTYDSTVQDGIGPQAPPIVVNWDLATDVPKEADKAEIKTPIANHGGFDVLVDYPRSKEYQHYPKVYSVVSKDHGVIEFETPNLFFALEYIVTAELKEKYWLEIMSGNGEELSVGPPKDPLVEDVPDDVV